MGDSIRRGAAFTRIALCAGATAAALALVGWWPTAARVGSAGVPAMLAAIAIALVGAWAGTAPAVWILNRPPQQHAAGLLTGLAVRFGVTIGLTLALWLTDAFAARPLLLWVGIAQFVILAVDVAGLSSILRRAAKEAA